MIRHIFLQAIARGGEACVFASPGTQVTVDLRRGASSVEYGRDMGAEQQAAHAAGRRPPRRRAELRRFTIRRASPTFAITARAGA